MPRENMNFWRGRHFKRQNSHQHGICWAKLSSCKSMIVREGEEERRRGREKERRREGEEEMRIGGAELRS